MEEQNNAQIIKEREKEFLRTFPKNANLGDNFDSLIKYGFFHFTNRENLESIEKKGLEPRIGKNSEGFETKKRSYFSIGAIGVLGIANRAIFLKSVELAKSRKASMEDVKQDAFSEIYEIYKNSVFLKLDIEDGVEYDSEDFMTRRNSHTIEGSSVHPSKMRVVSVGGEFNPLKLLEMFYENTDANSIRRSNIEDGNIEYVEENYLHEFIEYVRARSKDEKQEAGLGDISLPVIDIEEKKMEKDGYRKITIPRDLEKGFAFDFDIYVPVDTREDANLFLSFSSGFDIRAKTLMENIKAPVMIPKIEKGIVIDGQEINYDQFSPEALLDENGNIRPYGELDTGIVEQYKRAVDEAYRILKEEQIIKQDREEKIDVEGYSYHGVRAQRFAMLMPEKIRTVVVGGAYSSIPLPLENLDGMDLEYPTGFKGVDKILGEESTDRVLADYKDVIQVVYVTEQELRYDGSFSRDGKRMRDSHGRRVDYSAPTVSQHDISPDVVTVVIDQMKLWGTDVNDRANAAIDVVRQNGCALRKTKIYEGVDHHWNNPEKRLDSLHDMVTFVTGLDRLAREGRLDPHSSEIGGFDGGVARIDTSYEQKREEIQRRFVGEGITEAEFVEAERRTAREIVHNPEEDCLIDTNAKKFILDIEYDIINQERTLRDSHRSEKKTGLTDVASSGVRSSSVKEAEGAVLDLVKGKDENTQKIDAQNLGDN